MRWVAPTQSVPIAEPYHTRVTRHDRKLCWKVNDQTIGEANLADDELCMTERLILTNHGKGTGIFYGVHPFNPISLPFHKPGVQQPQP